jgi:hypothetical protein
VTRFAWWRLAGWILLVAAALGAGLWLRAHYAPEWLRPDSSQQPPALRPWAVEADCYSQLARVQRILQGHGLIQNHFTMENWPYGLTPSTTAPFDYVILLLMAPLALITRYPLDWAGALVSPVLWMAVVLFWACARSREFSRVGRAVLIIGSALLPPLIDATLFGRPRHQSLILALMALGLIAEFERWHGEMTPRRGWSLFAGIVWGFACWTSLYEPLLTVAVLGGFNGLVRRRESPQLGISFGVVMLVALVLEGPHICIPAPEYREPLQRWLGTIAEWRPVSPGSLMMRTGLALDLPQDVVFLFGGALILLLVAGSIWRRRDLTDRALILLTAIFTILTLVQGRWIYYASLGELILVARFVQAAQRHWTRWVALAGLGWGVVLGNAIQLMATRSLPPNQPSPQYVQIASAIDQPGGILAPWWISPGLLYFSGQPIVSGSSHCGIGGIVDSAHFFATDSWVDAEAILKARRVRWIVVYDDPRQLLPLLNSSQGILGLDPYNETNENQAGSTVAQILIEDRFVPTSLQLRAVTENLKLYEYLDAR